MPDLEPLHLRSRMTQGALLVDVDVTFTRPWTVIFGPSGSGKSTLLRVLAGLLQPRNSQVMLGEQDCTLVPPHLRGIVLAAQRPALFPHMTARQNVAFAVANRNRAETSTAAGELLHRVRAASFVDRKPSEISGGEAQRVALARALAARPRVLLLDEVFTGMQTSLRFDLIAVLREEQRERNMQVISVTHDVGEALTCADEVVKISNGRIVAQGPPDEVLAEERRMLLQQLG
jgi:molybdate transport system ATP-binding protein